MECIASTLEGLEIIAEEELNGKKVDNLHKQHVDQIILEKDGKKYKRIPEVLDCWFESGSMPYAQMHYPFENKELFEKGFPAQFIAEGVDQTSLWFHKLHVIATLLFNKPAFKNVIVNGIVLAEDGKKMSKRLRNYPDPMEVMERYGSDAVRYYLMSSPVVRAENLRFSEKEVAEVSRQFINILTNVVSFYDLYKDKIKEEKLDKNLLDHWILARLHETLKEETQAMDEYDLQTAARILQDFVTDLSTWYVRRSRERMKDGDGVVVFRDVLLIFSKMLAPFTPFLAEMVYKDVGGEKLSVHLEDWPEVVVAQKDDQLLEEMAYARQGVSAALERRAESGINVRQALASMKISGTKELSAELQEIIKDEVNVKSLVFAKADHLAVELDTTMTPELLREGLSREIIRTANAARKEAGLTIEDRIVLTITTENEEVIKAIKKYREIILEGVRGDELFVEFGAGDMFLVKIKIN